MTSKEIRKDILDFVRRLSTQKPDQLTNFLVQQAIASALHEIAAQLAELNESREPRPPRSRYEGL